VGEAEGESLGPQRVLERGLASMPGTGTMELEIPLGIGVGILLQVQAKGPLSMLDTGKMELEIQHVNAVCSLAGARAISHADLVRIALVELEAPLSNMHQNSNSAQEIPREV
jgi:hypothetical protein